MLQFHLSSFSLMLRYLKNKKQNYNDPYILVSVHS